LTSTLNPDVTISTDFAEVEVDDARINLTRFSLFFPERRQFFLEREGVFGFGVAGLDRPFYSRRIGLTADGEPVPIIGGARITGRAAGVDLGVLDMHTASTAGQPAENTAVVRLRRNFDGSDSYVGVMGTSRIGGGERNVIVGGNLELQLKENSYHTAERSQTFDSRQYTAAGGMLPHGKTRVQFERRNRHGFGLVTGVTGAAYRPSLGFVQRTAVHDAVGNVAWGVLTNQAGLRQVRPSITGSVIARNGSGDIETWNGTSGVELEFTSGARLTTEVEYTFENLAEAFPLDGGVDVPAGKYRFFQAGLALSHAQGCRIHLMRE
jgi:hypothetical protein